MVAHIMAVASRKGGVGKTTSAVNLVAEFAARGRTVLVVDLDTQGHAGIGLGANAGAKGRFAHDALRGVTALTTADVRETGVAGVGLLPADPDYMASRSLQDPHALGRALRELAGQFDDIVIDVAPAIDAAMVAALAACHRVLIPTQLNPLAADGVAKFAKVLFGVVTRVNRTLSDFAVLPTQADLRIVMQRAMLERFVREFGPARVLEVIRVDTALAEAFGAGMPVRHYRPRSRGALDYSAAAELLLASAYRDPVRLTA